MKRNVLLLIVAFALMSCSHDEENPAADVSGYLRVSTLSIQKSDVSVRSPLWNTEFPAGSKIGISLFGSESDSPLYTNTEWTGSRDSWSTETPVLLSGEKATAYAYYPYDGDVTDIESIPVNYNQSDYLYGKSDRSDICSDAGKNVVTFVMRHVMTRVALRVRKESTYKGDGLLTKAVLRNAPRRQVLPTNPDLIRFNAKTGTLSHSGLPKAGSSLELTTADNLPINYPVTLVTNTEGNLPMGSAIIAPFSFADGDIEFYLVVDGMEYIVPVPSPSNLSIQGANGGWNANYNYRYVLTLTPKHMTISSVVINDWVEIEDTPIEIK